MTLLQENEGQARPRLSDEDRFELMSAAEAARRRSRPVHLLLGAGVLLLVCVAALGWSFSQAFAARSRISLEQSRLGNAQVKVAELRSLRQKTPGSGNADTVWPREAQMLSKIKGFADETSLTGIPLGQESEDDVTVGGKPNPDVKRRRWRYRGVAAPELEKLTGWVGRVLSAVPGMFVTEFQVQPTQAGWTIDVTFARLEQTR